VRELKRSWWVGLALIPMGWLSWTAFLYAGLKARRRSRDCRSAHEAHLVDLPPDVVEELGDRAVFISRSAR
jgi:hypothetical protein